MDCYTLGQTLSHRLFGVVRMVHHPVRRTAGHVGRAIRHAARSIKATAPHLVIPRIACRPPPGFLAGLAKAAGIAVIGAPLLVGPALPAAISGIAPMQGVSASAIGGTATAGSAGVASAAPSGASGSNQLAAGPAILADTGSATKMVAVSEAMFSVAPTTLPRGLADALPPVGLDTSALIPTTVIQGGGTPMPPPSHPASSAVTPPSPVPEPTTLIMLASAILGLGMVRGRFSC